MKSHLIDLERKALQLPNAGPLKEAAVLFAAIVKEPPDWEHGTGFYDLACCHEDLADVANKTAVFSMKKSELSALTNRLAEIVN